MPPEPFAEQMTLIAAAHKEFPYLEARLKSKPDDGEAAAKMATILAARGQEKRAAELLALAEKSDTEAAKAALPKAYNALADYFQEKEEFDQAIPLFRKAIAAGQDPRDIAYAHLSIAVCYLTQRKLKESIPDLEATTRVPNCPPDLKKQAEELLARVKAAGGG